MLTLLQTRRTLRLTSAGRLLPWLGPALRGLVAGQFKQSVCWHDLGEQQTTWLHCKQQAPPRIVCPHMRQCPYGRTFESEPPPETARAAFSGQDDGARPLVLSPSFPMPDRARPGMAVPVKATFFGSEASSSAYSFWEAVAESGRDGGLGDHEVGFEVEPAGPDRWCWLDLPRDPGAVCGALSLVRVELTSPLLLRRGADPTEGRAHRQAVLRPTFGDLFRAGLRTIGALWRGYGQGPADADFAALREASEQVPAVREAWRQFTQPKWSSRKRQFAEVVGVTGWAEFGPVPAALVRWLVAAGATHVGGHRVAGAGGWRVHWSPDGGGEVWEEID